MFALPKAHTDCRRVFAYLIKRGISRDVVADFIRAGLLYESADYHNAVFVGRTAEGKPVNAYKRGTYDRNGIGFKGDVAGGDKNCAFCLDNDQWGREATERLCAKYTALGYATASRFPPKGKDWAEYAQTKQNCQSRGR